MMGGDDVRRFCSLKFFIGTNIIYNSSQIYYNLRFPVEQRQKVLRALKFGKVWDPAAQNQYHPIINDFLIFVYELYDYGVILCLINIED